MPELPEVETTVRGLRPHLVGKKMDAVTFHRTDLRFPLNKDWQSALSGKSITAINRRAKFLIFQTNSEHTFTWHLGMSGSLRITEPSEPLKTHDHVCIDVAGKQLRYHDPRRFGWLSVFENEETLLVSLKDYGIEPLSDAFDDTFLHEKLQRANRHIKVAIMDQKLVVGVGNIYACEALFRAGIHPKTQAKNVSKLGCDKLATEIKTVLIEAITAGGTTLKDFINPDAQPGYFAQTLQVYGRAGESCRVCSDKIQSEKIGGRNTFYCPTCQKRK